jgi:hypothetical protein
MKNLKRINEAVGSIVERRAAADRLLKDVVKGSTSSVEGIKLSKEMAQAFLDWQRMSTYGKKFGKLPFYMLFTAAFNWGLDRYIGKDKKIKDEYKELKAKAKEMSKQQKMKAESLNESTAKNVLKDAINALTKTFAGKKLDKAYVKDYIASMERMARKSPREFVKDYMNFSNDDWIEDVEYNMANENVNENKFNIALNKMDEWLPEDPEAMERYMEILNQEGPKDMEKFFIEFGDEDRLQSYGLKSRDMKKLAKMAFESEEVNEGFRRSREPFTFTAKEVQDAADLIAKAIARMDKVKAEVHDMEYVEGEGASFEISMDGEKYEGGSYDVRPTGEVVNVAIGNSFPNAIYTKIGDKNINQIMKNIKKFESVEVNEAAPRMKKSKEVEELEKIKSLVVNARKGGIGNRYGKEFDRAKNKAVVALDNMISYAKIGI